MKSEPRAYLGSARRYCDRVSPSRPRARRASGTGRARPALRSMSSQTAISNSITATAQVGYLIAIRRSSRWEPWPARSSASSLMPGLWPTKPTQSTASESAQRAGEQHLLGRVVEPELLLQFDPARPMRGEDLGRLLGAQRAGVDEHLGQPLARPPARRRYGARRCGRGRSERARNRPAQRRARLWRDGSGTGGA